MAAPNFYEAPATPPLDLPTRSRWASLWWFPTGVFGAISLLSLLLTALGLRRIVGAVTGLGMRHPVTERTIRDTLIAAGLGFGCGLIAYAWHHRRWVRALILMALLGGPLVLLIFAPERR